MRLPSCGRISGHFEAADQLSKLNERHHVDPNTHIRAHSAVLVIAGIVVYVFRNILEFRVRIIILLFRRWLYLLLVEYANFRHAPDAPKSAARESI